MQSRMNATMRFIVWGTIPIGFVLGGILASIMPVRAALILAALACATSFLPVLFSPLRHLEEIPGDAGLGDEGPGGGLAGQKESGAVSPEVATVKGDRAAA